MDPKNVNENLIAINKMDPKMKQAVMEAAQKRANALIMGGRAIAGALFQAQIADCKSQQETGEKLFMLRMAAIHILAMDAFNYEKGTGGKGNLYIDQITIDIRNELKWLQIEELAGRLKKVDAVKEEKPAEVEPPANA